MGRVLRISNWLTERREDLFTPRGAIFLLGKASLLLAVWLALRTGEILYEAEKIRVAPLSLEGGEAAAQHRVQRPVESYKVILSRNLFGAAAATQTAAPAAAAGRPKLRLVGTNPQARGGAFAIIEDLNKNEQDVFELQETVFSSGKLIEVNPLNVRLESIPWSSRKGARAPLRAHPKPQAREKAPILPLPKTK